MRATISFETDVDEVEGTMAVLACSEEHNLRAAADLLSNFTVLDGSVLDAITEALRLLDMSVGQLRQYQQMMLSFEKAKFETMLPQSVEQAIPVVDNMEKLNEVKKNMQGLESFLDRITEEGATDGARTEEG
jgi:hypothetical protein